MRRAAIQSLRTARRTPVRRLVGGRPPSAVGFRAAHLSTTRKIQPRQAALQSSLLFRNFSLAFISTVVASGAWFALKGNPEQGFSTSAATSLSNSNTPTASTQKSITPSDVFSSATTAAPTAQVSTEEAEQATRKALVVGPDQLYTGAIVGDGPISKNVDSSGRKVVEMLTPEQATQKLRKNEESYLVGRGKGVTRYDLVQLASNDPVEDDHSEKIIEVPAGSAAGAEHGSDWMFWGVFDGHSGWTTSAKLRQTLITYVSRELNTTYKSASADPAAKMPAAESIDEAIKRGFMKLDNEICHESVEKVFKANSKNVAAELLAPALSGSCALLSFYDSRTQMLRVACTGDSRAVLGRKGSNGRWTATALSEDQTGDTESEVQRMRKEHPGEENTVIRHGRVLGNLQPTRAFGDAFYKWSKEVQVKLKRSYFGRTPHGLLKTPPYVTAEPVITTTKIEPGKGDFLVMATDGLWEMLSNEEVVGLVGQWIDAQKSSGTSTWMASWFGTKQNLPVERPSKDDTTGQRAPIRQQQYAIEAKDERFIVEDRNVATHLIRNALGGRDQDMVCALLTLPAPYSRRYRDDLTVQVIFFGDSAATGSIEVNKEATAQLKPKL